MSSLEGFGKGRIDPEYPGVDDGVPLLREFYFRFQELGPSEAVDNHINCIMVLPAGVPEDLSPNAGLPLKVVEDGKVTLMYSDDELDAAKDQYFYRIAHSNAPVDPRRFQIRAVGCRGTCEHDLPSPSFPNAIPGVFVLVGFQLFFTGARDHHIDEVAVFEKDGKLTVKLNDKNDEDVFAYFVDYALVLPVGQNIQVGEASGSAVGGAHEPLPQGKKVIRGFHFDFVSGDRHLREIGVLMNNDNVEVFYGDASGNDEFRWNVRWAMITPQAVIG
jgi:hypothetical protein